VSTHWADLKKYCQEGSALHELVVAWRNQMTQNPGNRTKGPGKALSPTDILDGDAFMDQLEEDHGPTDEGLPGKPFWLPANKWNGQDGPVLLPNDPLDDHPLYCGMAFDGVETRCRKLKEALQVGRPKRPSQRSFRTCRSKRPVLVSKMCGTTTEVWLTTPINCILSDRV
jgi:hypothetical protein